MSAPLVPTEKLGTQKHRRQTNEIKMSRVYFPSLKVSVEAVLAFR